MWLLSIVLCAALAWTCSASCRSDNTKLSDSAAREMLTNAGISIYSSGGCSDRSNSHCTSLEQVRCQNIRDVIELKSKSGCNITVTGGTETGHARGTNSHSNGYKLDIRKTSCINSHIEAFGKTTTCPYDTYYDETGNRYYDEGNHWGITFF